MNASELRLCELAPATTGDGSETTTVLAQVMPHIAFDDFLHVSDTFSVGIEAEALANWTLFLSGVTGLYDEPLLQMTGFVPPAATFVFASGAVDGTGQDTFTAPVPAAAAAVVGVPFTVQMLAFSPATGGFRWSNVRSFVIAP